MVGKLKNTWQSLDVSERILLYIAFILTCAILAWAIELRAGI